MKTKDKKARKHPDFHLWEALDYGELDYFDRLDWLLHKKRIIMFTGEVNENLCARVAAELLIMSESKDDIKMIINTPGGSHFDGLMVIDLMDTFIKNGGNITADVCGCAYSMGLDVLLSASYRVAHVHSRFLLHELSDRIGEMNVSNMEDYLKESKDINKQLNKRIVEKSNLTDKELKKIITRTDHFFGVEKALEYGFIDEVL
jgi:ATP-dependent Clp endopeptidase proteolytic subunit ClpP